MNILVTGASGFIGSQIVTDLLKAGHRVTCCVRNTAYTQTLFPATQVIACDFIRDTTEDRWIPRLGNIDVVINCVGILYHPNKKIIWAIHHDTPRALFQASAKVGIKKIIQISALGVADSPVEYAKSKKAIEDYLLTLPLTAIILRPSFVYGRGSYGGSSLFRGLAGLPWITPVPGNGSQTFQPIYLPDLSKAIQQLIQSSPTESVIFSAVSEKRVTLRDILIKIRAWLGFAKSILFFVPLGFIRLGSWFGDFIAYSSMNTTSYKMLMQNNITSDEETKKFHQAIGFVPQNFYAGIDSQPSTVQDHWHARLYFLKPLLQLGIAFVWIFSAIANLFFYPHAASFELLAQMGVNAFFQPILFYGACAVDAILGFAMLFGWQLKKISILQIFIVFIYSMLITWKLPHLWLEPFAPIVKNIPLIIATLVLLALESDR